MNRVVAILSAVLLSALPLANRPAFAQSATTAQAVTDAPSSGPVELPYLRTRTSRTYAQNGHYLAQM